MAGRKESGAGFPMPIKAVPYHHQMEAFRFACGLFGILPGEGKAAGSRDAPPRQPGAGCALLMEMGTGKIADFPYCLVVLAGSGSRNVVHYGFIEAFIEELGTRYHIREVAFDRWGATQMVQNLEGLGFTVVPFGQGFKDMSPPTKELMRLTLDQKIAHGGNPVLRWMMDNIHVRTDPAGSWALLSMTKGGFCGKYRWRCQGGGQHGGECQGGYQGGGSCREPGKWRRQEMNRFWNWP